MRKSAPKSKVSKTVKAPQLIQEGIEELFRFARLSPRDRHAELSAAGIPLPTIVDRYWISTMSYRSFAAVATLFYDEFPKKAFARKLWTQQFVSECVRYAVSILDSGNIPAALPIQQLKDLAIAKCDAQIGVRWHYLPVFLFRDSLASSFDIGPVQFLKGDEVANFARNHGTGNEKPRVGDDELKRLVDNDWIAAVEIPNADMEVGHLRAKRIVKLAVMGIDLLTGNDDCPMKIRVVDELVPAAHIQRFSEKNGVFAVGHSKFIGAVGWEPGFVAEFLRESDEFFRWLGESLHAYCDPSKAIHPQMREKWLSSLFWYGLARDELDDFAAVVNYGAALDTALGEGNGVPDITKFLSVLVDIKADSIFVKNPELTLHQAVEAVYGEGRSKVLHGGIPTLSSDFAFIRGLGQVMTQIALYELVPRLSKYIVKYKHDNWSAFRKSVIRSAVPRARGNPVHSSGAE